MGYSQSIVLIGSYRYTKLSSNLYVTLFMSIKDTIIIDVKYDSVEAPSVQRSEFICNINSKAFVANAIHTLLLEKGFTLLIKDDPVDNGHLCLIFNEVEHWHKTRTSNPLDFNAMLILITTLLVNETIEQIQISESKKIKMAKCINNEGMEDHFDNGIEYKIVRNTTDDEFLTLEDANGQEKRAFKTRFAIL